MAEARQQVAGSQDVPLQQGAGPDYPLITKDTEIREALREEVFQHDKVSKLAVEGYSCYGLELVGNYLYASLYNAVDTSVGGKIAKLSRGDLSLVKTLDLPYAGSGDIVFDDKNLYVGYRAAASHYITKVDIETFTVVGNVSLPVNTAYIIPDLLATYLYAGSFEDPGRIFKIDLTTFTHIATLTLNPEETRIHGFGIDWAYLYAGTATMPGRVARVRLSDFTRVDAITFDENEDECGAILSLAGRGYTEAKGEDYIYAASIIPSVHLLRINRLDFTKQDSIELFLNADCRKMGTDGEFIYMPGGGWESSPANIGVVRLSDLRFVGIIRLQYPPKVKSTQGFYCKPVFDENFMYLVSGSNPAIAWKKRLQREYVPSNVKMRLWSAKTVPIAGATTKAFPAEYDGKKTVWIISDKSGTLYIQAYDEQAKNFKDVDAMSASISANKLTPYNIVDTRAKSMMVRFVPSADATVSCWVVF